jgi:hypothetical protein
MMGAKSDGCFVGFELRLRRRALFNEVFRMSFAVAAQCTVLGDWLETSGLSQAIQLIQPPRR